MGAIVAVILVLVLVAFGFKTSIKKQATLQAAQVVTKMYAVWAEMGPYENGAASANSLRYAFSATNKNKSAKLTKIVNLVKHAEAYDADPKAWERLRQSSLSGHLSEIKSTRFGLCSAIEDVEQIKNIFSEIYWKKILSTSVLIIKGGSPLVPTEMYTASLIINERS